VSAAGEEITISKRGLPLALLVSVEVQKGKRQLSFCEWKFTVPVDSDAPLPDEILDAFEGTA
jgi:antitoxin (DNA-binding transcriptional repressor) of toxin-antitoxin stability system